MRNIKMLLQYDGTRYKGWQKQNQKGNSVVTIQGKIENVLSKMTGEEIEVIGCGRTDSGVHAKGFIANFKTESTIPSNKFREALNYRLPEDIVILKSEEVSDDFHSRYSAKGKTYSYSIINRDIPSAIYRNYYYHKKYIRKNYFF